MSLIRRINESFIKNGWDDIALFDNMSIPSEIEEKNKEFYVKYTLSNLELNDANFVDQIFNYLADLKIQKHNNSTIILNDEEFVIQNGELFWGKTKVEFKDNKWCIIQNEDILKDKGMDAESMSSHDSTEINTLKPKNEANVIDVSCEENNTECNDIQECHCDVCTCGNKSDVLAKQSPISYFKVTIPEWGIFEPLDVLEFECYDTNSLYLTLDTNNFKYFYLGNTNYSVGDVYLSIYNKNNTLIDRFTFKDMYIYSMSTSIKFQQNFDKKITSYLTLCTKDKMKEREPQC